ncbi:hypothetical protein Tco_0600849 [Tanacetum coccineum]
MATTSMSYVEQATREADTMVIKERLVFLVNQEIMKDALRVKDYKRMACQLKESVRRRSGYIGALKARSSGVDSVENLKFMKMSWHYAPPFRGLRPSRERSSPCVTGSPPRLPLPPLIYGNNVLFRVMGRSIVVFFVLSNWPVFATSANANVLGGVTMVSLDTDTDDSVKFAYFIKCDFFQGGDGKGICWIGSAVVGAPAKFAIVRRSVFCNGVDVVDLAIEGGDGRGIS